MENEIFVAGVPPTADNKGIEAHFSKYGKVVRVNRSYNHRKQSYKTFAFVAFKTAASMKTAIAAKDEVSYFLL